MTKFNVSITWQLNVAKRRKCYSPAKRILMRSRGCRINVDVTPPDMPATRCSYLMWLNKANLEDDELGFVIVVMPK